MGDTEPMQRGDEAAVEREGDEVVVAGARFPAGAIRSVRVHREPAAATGPVLMVVVGVLCLLSASGNLGAAGIAIGAGLLVGAGIWWLRKQPSFQVRVETGSGEATPFETRDAAAAEAAVAAIERARGARETAAD